ncbi:MAG: glycoside hydrolase family 97 catalytic domain-containing protein, partial [Bacteroidaceae bacterium]|nr:glycoside hydrolase family 97 catalytic domain-containing protein [Bacteroidaceae bacterium]
TMPMRLAPASEIADPSWIRPGKTTWEWWNGSIPYGPDVNFKSGLNIETYKYFVDFAAANGLEYILMDEGWAKSTRDPFTPNPDIDLHELIDYAKSKNVGVILWLTWLTVENHPTMFETFEKWGVAGVKIDFMDRQDQWMVKFYERTAKAAAEHHIFVDYHGAYHPSGLEYKYPNVLTFEGVRGMEYMGGCTPRNSAYYPAIRNAAGPMDYTPGAMLCAQPDCYSSRRPNSASIGTRAFQMALYVVFESNLQMLADNPTLYNMYPDCRDYIASCPVNWDETRVLAAEFGEYTIVARRSGNKWYIGGITNETARDIDVKLDFLAEGLSYNATSFTDGINSSVQAMDYRRESTRLSRNSTIRIHMVRNGGYAAVLEP